MSKIKTMVVPLRDRYMRENSEMLIMLCFLIQVQIIQYVHSENSSGYTIRYVYFAVCLSYCNKMFNVYNKNISSVQMLSHVQFFATPWTAASQASLSITNSWSLLKLMSIKSVTPSNHLILCCPFSSCFNLSQLQGLFQ